MNEYEKEYNKVLNDLTARYGKDVTYSDFLSDVATKLFGQKFIGVFPSNKIPTMKRNTYAIINLDRSDQPGSHWVAVVKGKNNNVYLYDSFGRKGYKILPALRQSGNGTVLDTEYDAEQDKQEENCGQRSLSFLVIYDRYGWKGAKHI